jgi:cell division septation protein DedD
MVLAAPNNVLALEGVEWVGNLSYDKENAWLVELPGLYHRKTIDAAWLDLRTRFPLLMEHHSLRRYQRGRMEDSTDKRLSWYQLYIAKFPTAVAAEELCAALQADHQRCRVVLSQKGEIVETAHSTMHMDSTLIVSPLVKSSPVLTPKLDSEEASRPAQNAGTPVHQLTLAKEIPPSVAPMKEELISDVPSKPKTAPPVVQTVVTPESAIKAGEESKVATPTGSPVAKVAVVETPHVATPPVEVLHAEMVAIALPHAEVPATEAQSADSKDLPNTEQGQAKAGVQQVYVVQLGTYRYASKAIREASSWQEKGYEAYVREYRRSSGRIWYKILAGSFSRHDEAEALATAISHKEGVRTAVSLVATGEDGKPGKIIDAHPLAEGK